MDAPCIIVLSTSKKAVAVPGGGARRTGLGRHRRRAGGVAAAPGRNRATASGRVGGTGTAGRPWRVRRLGGAVVRDRAEVVDAGVGQVVAAQGGAQPDRPEM